MGLFSKPEPKQPKTIYDFFRHLITTQNWITEEDKIEYEELVNKMESMNMFGNMGVSITTDVERIEG